MQTAYDFVCDETHLKGFWFQNPALRLLLFAFIGIILDFIFQLSYINIIYLSISIMAIAVPLCFSKFNSVAYILLAVGIGFIITFNTKSLSIPRPDKIIPESKAMIKGQIIDVINQTPKSFRCLVQGTIDTKILPAYNNCKAIVSVYKLEDKPLNLQIGNEILGFGDVRLPEKQQFKGDFDEELYAKSFDVQFFGRVKAKDVSVLSPPLRYLLYEKACIY